MIMDLTFTDHDDNNIYNVTVGCREAVLYYVKNKAIYGTQKKVVISFRNFVNIINITNSKLVYFITKKCDIAKKLFLTFEVVENSFKFELNSEIDTRYYIHFISFLCLMVSTSLMNIKTRTKKMGVWGDIKRECIAKNIISIINSAGIAGFSINKRDALIGYVNVIVKDNKLIRGDDNTCNGPESAYNYM